MSVVDSAVKSFGQKAIDLDDSDESYYDELEGST